MKTKLIFFLLLFLIVLLSCTKVEKKELNFCQKLSNCNTARIEVEDSKTKDIYELSILGMNKNFCSIDLSLVEVHTEQLKPLEKSKAICDQEWSSKFEKIARFDEPTCKRYVDNLLFNLITNVADKNSNVCSGELKERLLQK